MDNFKSFQYQIQLFNQICRLIVYSYFELNFFFFLNFEFLRNLHTNTPVKLEFFSQIIKFSTCGYLHRLIFELFNDLITTVDDFFHIIPRKFLGFVRSDTFQIVTISEMRIFAQSMTKLFTDSINVQYTFYPCLMHYSEPYDYCIDHNYRFSIPKRKESLVKFKVHQQKQVMRSFFSMNALHGIGSRIQRVYCQTKLWGSVGIF